MPAATLRTFVSLTIAIALSACGNPNAVPVKAQIASIDRKCSYKQIVGEYKGRPVTGGSDTREMLPCDTTTDFEEMRKKPKERRRSLVGKAVVTVNFDSPVDRSPQTAELTLDGSDDEFYSFRYGDTIDLTVDKTDLSKVALATD